MTVKSVVIRLCPSSFRTTFTRFIQTPIGSRFASGLFWSIVGAVISRGLLLLSTIITARILGKNVFGELGIVRSTFGMLSVFAGFGLGLTATKHVAEYRETAPDRASRIISLSWLVATVTGAIMAIGLLIFAPWLAIHTINAPHLAGILRLGSFLLFIDAINGAQTGTLAGFEAFRAVALVNLFVGLFSFPILVAGAYFWGLTGAVWALIINLFITLVFNHFALRRETNRHNVPLSFNLSLKELPVLWRFSLPAAIGGVLVGPVTWACSALLVNQQGGYGEMAIFNAATQWQFAILFIPQMVGKIALPMLSNLKGFANEEKYLRILKLNLFITGSAAFVIATGVMAFSRLIMRSYGPGFEEGTTVMVCLAFSTILVSINNIVGQVIASRGSMWLGFIFNLCWACVLLVSTYFLLSLGFGALGLAFSNLIAYMFHTFLQSIYISTLLQNKS